MAKDNSLASRVIKLEKEVSFLKGFVEYFSGGGALIRSENEDKDSGIFEYLSAHKIPFECLVMSSETFRIPESAYLSLQDAGYKVRKVSYEELNDPEEIKKRDGEVRKNMKKYGLRGKSRPQSSFVRL